MVKEQKILPINKYSVYELKAGIDKEITTFLEEEDFEENQKYSNLKILFGLFTVTCTGIAYLYPKPFPDNYYILSFTLSIGIRLSWKIITFLLTVKIP